MNEIEIKKWLRYYGHHRRFGEPGRSVVTANAGYLKNLIRSAQGILGLLMDGEAGPKTIAAMQMPRCGCPDFRRQRDEQMIEFPEACQLSIGVYADFGELRGNVSPSQAKELWWESLQTLAKAVNVKFRWVGRIEDAHIQAHVGRAKKGVLAWMEMFYGCEGQHASRYNGEVHWTEQLFYSTALHENAHGLGIDHSPVNIRSIMGPTEDPSIPAIVDAWLLGQLEPRYGLNDGGVVVPTLPTNPDTNTNTPTPTPGAFGMDWSALMAILIPILIDCFDSGAGDAEVEAALIEPNSRQRRFMRRGIKKHVKKTEPSLSRRDRRVRVDTLLDSVVSRGSESTQRERKDVIRQAREKAA